MKNLFVILLFIVCLSTTAFAKVNDFTWGNQLSLIEDASESVDIKVDLIRKAKHHIHIITYFWDDSEVPKRLAAELNLANERGVEVRIITSYLPTLGTDFLGKGKASLNHNNPTKENYKISKTATFTYFSLTPGKDFTLTNSFHEKIFLVDGEVAIIGGRNISDSSINGKDLEILMRGSVVNQVQEHFRSMYDFMIYLRVIDKCNPGQFLYEDCGEIYNSTRFLQSDNRYFGVQPFYENGAKARILTHDALFYQHRFETPRSKKGNQQDDILDTTLEIEFEKLRAYNYFIIPTPRYKKYLEKNLDNGKSIQIITNSHESAKFSSNLGYVYSIPDAIDLVKKGLGLYQWERNQKLNYVHEKVMIFDEDHAIVGSHNYGVGSTTVSNEIAIEFTSKKIVNRLIEVFETEIKDTKITNIADLDFLKMESKKYKKQIKILRKKSVKNILLEIY